MQQCCPGADPETLTPTTQKMPRGEQVASMPALAKGPPVVLIRRRNSSLSARKVAISEGQGSSGPASSSASGGASSAGAWGQAGCHFQHLDALGLMRWCMHCLQVNAFLIVRGSWPPCPLPVPAVRPDVMATVGKCNVSSEVKGVVHALQESNLPSSSLGGACAIARHCRV